ncbi:hypothetical protein [Usitatibacter palustris]|uniref:Uncharacterized protein n=1 Tax=Usitatibacter palustris TaxID=2732487 RepID=A0A6M4HBT5_9PROT|nr:hypothetical protein [Usitatibacter palustris]QJR16702.1 hypothetical protein DSM104440_03538 [Usitatibacter palustris]
MTEPASTGPAGYIQLAILALVSGLVLATLFSLTLEAPEWFQLPVRRPIIHATQAAIALLIWLPITQPMLRGQVVSLAETGAFPPTIQPARAAWILAVSILAVVVAHDIVTEGQWLGTHMGIPRGGLATVLFLVSFPFLTWIAVHTSLGGTPVETIDEKATDRTMPAPRSLYGPTKPSGVVLPAGSTRDRVIAMIATLDEVDDQFVSVFGREGGEAALRALAMRGEDTKRIVDALWSPPLPAEVPMILQSNLATSGAAYCDAVRIVEAPPSTAGDEVRRRAASKYRDLGSFGDDSLGLVLAVARGARDNAAVDAGVEPRTWWTLRTR